MPTRRLALNSFLTTTIMHILKYALTASLHHFILIYVQLIWMLGLTEDIWNIFK